jgi:2-oxoglutarate/2-oxoacid ferredoxin oxidoreductase subunit beta
VSQACSLLHLAGEEDREFTMADYEGALARWCPGCGDHSVLTAVQRLLVQEQLKPEETVFVSGIGCSSRFPHYVKTYGFHGIHGRALPISTGIKLHRPELNVFAVMGDGDCVSIGAGHWIHAVRYNVDMVALLLDNNVYGLTKNQTSPTSPRGTRSNTQPQGSWLPPMNPLTATLGVSNVSFLAQTAEWIPSHLFATLKAAFNHRGFSFVRIVQRCPAYLPKLYEEAIANPDAVELLVHPDGLEAKDLEGVYKNRVRHDPKDLDAARRFAEDDTVVRLGVFFRDEDRPVYEDTRRLPKLTAEEKLQELEKEFDRHAV